MKHRRIVMLLPLVLLAGIGLLVVRARSGPKAVPIASVPAGQAPVLKVEAVTVEAVAVQASNALSGQIEPFQTAAVAAEVANRIVRRPVERGDRVAQGAVLMVLDSEAAQTGLMQARSALAQATAGRQQAETEYERAVVETDAGRQQARAQVAQAQADEQKAQAVAAQAQAGERKVRSYTRAQELRQAEEALSQAKTDEKLARIEQERYTFLVKQGAAPQQMLDRTQATLDAAIARRQSAEQGVSLAQEGARQEDKDVANAQVASANAGVRAAAQQTETARAGLRIANTRETRLAVIRRQIEGLRAQEKQAQETIRQAEIALEKRTIRAPFAGRVLATLADVGDMASPGMPLVRLGAIAKVKAMFAVPEASRPNLRLNQNVTLTADALPGRTFRGTIMALGFQADARSRAFPIEITLANADESLLPNMVARLRLNIGGAQSRLVIPASAVASSGAETGVFVLNNGRATQRTVTLGASVGEKVVVLKGLTVGERIAATPQRISDGARIEIRRTEPQEVAR